MRALVLFPIVLIACGGNSAGGSAGSDLSDASTDDAVYAFADAPSDSFIDSAKDSAADAIADAVDACPIGALCEHHNEFGTCKGLVKECAIGTGAPGCDAPVPKPETCNQLDDDCNGVTDDNLCEDGDPATTGYCIGSQCAQKPACDDGDACTTDTWQNGACAHSPGSGCSIGGVCHAAGELDPQNACNVCNPLQSKTSFVAQEGLTCDDGDACTLSDACHKGKCQGTALACPSTGCGTASCVAGKCVASGTTGVCKPGDVGTCADPCEEQLCGANCQWQACAIKASAKCVYKSGTNHQCCAAGSWQFCSKLTCDWYPCQADPQSGCP